MGLALGVPRRDICSGRICPSGFPDPDHWALYSLPASWNFAGMGFQAGRCHPMIEPKEVLCDGASTVPLWQRA